MTALIRNSLTHPLADGHPPAWASAWGHDRFGAYADCEVLTNDYKPATQRLRWIPPGHFLMGSAVKERARFKNEGPQHKVTISQGYWLFDTPCTQELWLAVMGGTNPSYFTDFRRPVEQVSFDDVENFLVKLNSLVAGLELALPTEAQWEYACRAGTTTATYAGDLEILGENNAPVLDPIAWYGGNSGHDYDHEIFSESSDWYQKQYPHTKAGTRHVGLKLPNAWGLYDMLGNVWEWCSDWWDEKAYGRGNDTDPEGPATGSKRVIRGGSWGDDAEAVRAAQRDALSPGNQIDSLGFRCLSSCSS